MVNLTIKESELDFLYSVANTVAKRIPSYGVVLFDLTRIEGSNKKELAEFEVHSLGHSGCKIKYVGYYKGEEFNYRLYYDAKDLPDGDVHKIPKPGTEQFTVWVHFKPALPKLPTFRILNV